MGFFADRGHAVMKSAPLVPENDPTVLFTTAGMHPLVPYLSGQAHPLGKRLVNCQKCIRTVDIDEVGDEVHLTFFEMLGNWSLGDYFKKEALEFSYEFLTSEKWLGISIEKLAVTVFAGDGDAPFDAEAFGIWKALGINEKKIAKRPKKDNWWGPAGQTGPCGPDTEVFYWTGDGLAPADFNPEDPRWVEIWNNVFMQYSKNAEGGFEILCQKNVDTGMGLERVTAVLQGKKTCYETELFTPLLLRLSELSGSQTEAKTEKSRRIIADHMRAATFMIADGIIPGNVDQGYVLRRLIRRSIREGKKLSIGDPFTHLMAETVIDNYGQFYLELEREKNTIIAELKKEEEQFGKTIEKGMREFEKTIAKIPAHVTNRVLGGRNAFYLYETYGFPIELTEEMASENGFKVDRKGFEESFLKHQELSRKGAEQKFKGGLADNSEATTRLHTATHLLHAALRKVLGEHATQKGSNINEERLRFDFSHSEKMTPEQIREVESIVNDAIRANLRMTCEEMSVEEAKKSGAIGLFIDKYGEKVKVYNIEGFSREICGGPHVEDTGVLGKFRILKEESSSQGVRRIKAVLE